MLLSHICGLITIASDLHCFILFCFTTCRYSFKIIIQYLILNCFLVIIFRCIINDIDKFNCNFRNIADAFFIINNTMDISILSWGICILIEVTFYFWYALIKTTARFYMSYHLFLLIFYHCWFTDHYLCEVFYESTTWTKSPNKNSHLVFYSSFAFFIQCFVLIHLIFTWKVAG
jgi:hypothetical protein